MVGTGNQFNRGGGVMRKAFLIAGVLVLCSCGGSTDNMAANLSTEGNGAAAATTVEEAPGLQPGLYEITLIETIAGAGQNEEQHQQQCVSRDLANHPENLLANASMQGCSSTQATRDGNRISGELRCEDNHNVLIAGSFGSDSWQRTITGQGPNGTYEGHENAHRVGDC
jgi:hypothetical protein